MILGTRKIAGLFVLCGAVVSLCACAGERSASNSSGARVAYAASRDSQNLAVYQPIAAPVKVVANADTLNTIESAAGGPVAAAGIAPAAVGPEALLEEAVALQGCDYSGRFADEDKLGYRWGEGSRNRLGLDFGGGNRSGAGSAGVKFGYKFTFDSPKAAGKNGC